MANPGFEDCLARCTEQSSKEGIVYLPLGCELQTVIGGVVRYTIHGFHPGTIYATDATIDKGTSLEFKAQGRNMGDPNLLSTLQQMELARQRERRKI